MLPSFQKLVDIARTLRGPSGCPWDKSRTILSLQKDFMEEAEEVKQALEKEDYANLREELGDILFNIVLMGVIAEEEKRFTLKEILQEVEKKIVSRHTWVFGKDKGKVKTPEEALAQWATNKRAERSVPRKKF